MKREFLQNFKVGDQSLPKEIIDAILDENGKDIESVKGKYADYDVIKKQLDEANRTIDGFKDMDIDTVRKEAADWKQKAEQAERDAAESDDRKQDDDQQQGRDDTRLHAFTPP